MLRQMNNGDLFQLYDSDLVFRFHNAKNLADTRKILNNIYFYCSHFHYPLLHLHRCYILIFNRDAYQDAKDTRSVR